uniref:Uncharacterized protein n=1 Tax=Rhizophora mucronata TaxID=61149 RepID=A0A2P2QVM2_RHIMU
MPYLTVKVMLSASLLSVQMTGKHPRTMISKCIFLFTTESLPSNVLLDFFM